MKTNEEVKINKENIHFLLVYTDHNCPAPFSKEDRLNNMSLHSNEK